MDSFITEWSGIDAKATAVGMTRPFFNLATDTLAKLQVHSTTLNPGLKSHEPHQHPEEEMILLREGELEILHSGKLHRMGAGSIFIAASNDLHGVRNCGEVPAVYYVIKWFPPQPAKEMRCCRAATSRS